MAQGSLLFKTKPLDIHATYLNLILLVQVRPPFETALVADVYQTVGYNVYLYCFS